MKCSTVGLGDTTNSKNNYWVQNSQNYPIRKDSSWTVFTYTCFEELKFCENPNDHLYEKDSSQYNPSFLEGMHADYFLQTQKVNEQES